MKQLIELMENFTGTINVLSNDGKIYEINDLIKDFNNKKEFKAVGINYWLVDSFGKAYQGNRTSGQNNDIDPITGLKEILVWIAELLEEDGHTYQHCESCGHIFTSDEGMYRIGDSEYLCEGECFKNKFPTNREWYIYALEDWWKDDDYEEEWTSEELKKLSDEELRELMDEAVEDSEFTLTYIEA